MRSFISSSEARRDWLRPLLLGTLLALLAFAVLDGKVRRHGLHIGVVDSADLWAFHRARANEAGVRPLVLVGSSRMLLGIDTDELARLGGRPVVQLAMDGEPFAPVLADLAQDPDFRGDVLVALHGQQLTLAPPAGERASAWVAHWQRHYRGSSPAGWLDRQLGQRAQALSAWYGSELPATVLLARLLDDTAPGSPVTTRADRSRRMVIDDPVRRSSSLLARIRRDARTLPGVLDAPDVDAAAARVRAALPQLPPAVIPDFAAFVQRMQANTTAIGKRGGRVVFIRFPTDGVIRELEQARWPDPMYLDRFSAALPGHLLDAATEPLLARYPTVDGSHLDGHYVTAFTGDLYRLLVDRKLLP